MWDLQELIKVLQNMTKIVMSKKLLDSCKCCKCCFIVCKYVKIMCFYLGYFHQDDLN